MKWVAAAVAGLALCACCPAQPASAPPPSAVGVARAEPRLVVVVVLDQFPSWALLRYLPHLPEDGAIRRGIARGSFFERTAYPYALTNTAPGHAAIFTGAAPYQSGVTTNTVYDVASGKSRPFVSDGKHPVLGNPERTASPTGLRVPTVGDQLKAVTGGKAAVVAISAKDRAAVISGGRRADAAIWYDYTIPAFTTSTFYAQSPPAWLQSHLQTNPLQALMTSWRARDPALLARVAGPDDAPGEGDHLGLGVTFPHDLTQATEPWSALRLFPQLSEYTIQLAAAAARELSLGTDDVVDLLALSISGLDYTGHTFGAHSWEYCDHLLRVDVALARLLDQLDRERGPISVLITSDHGVMPLPPQNAGASGRLYPAEIETLAREAVQEALGDSRLVRAFVRPYLFFDPALAEGPDRAKAVAAIAGKLQAHAGIHLAADVREAVGWRDHQDRVRRAIGLSVAETMPGDVFVLPADGWVVDEHRPHNGGTTHGTPWDSDRYVPTIVWGPGVPNGRHAAEVSQARVAPTIATLLAIDPPGHITAEALPGLQRGLTLPARAAGD